MKLLFLPLEPNKLFHQNGPRDAWKRIVGENNFRNFSFVLESKAYGKSAMNNKLYQQVMEFKPDVIYMQLQETNEISLDVLRKIKHELPKTIIINWSGDYRPYLQQRFLEVGKIIDLSLFNNAGQFEAYRERGIKRIEYMQIGTDCGIYRPLGLEKQPKIIFCGNYGHSFKDSKKRNDLIIELSKSFPGQFEVYGSGWKNIGLKGNSPVYHNQANELYNRVRITIGVNAINDLPLYFSERQLTNMASGTLHICHYVPRLEEYFRNRYHCVWFKSIKECVSLVKIYFQHPEVCDEIGGYGAKKVQEEHTWDCRFKELLTRL